MKNMQPLNSIKSIFDKHREVSLIGAFILVVIFPFVCNQIIIRKYVDGEVGYEVIGPRQWRMTVAPDKRSVEYKSGRSMIRLHKEIGNSYGNTPYEYIVNGVVPNMKHTYEKRKGVTVDVREQPYSFERKGQEWATASFYVNYTDLHVFYATMVKDYVLVLTLISNEENEFNDGQLLEKTLNSIVFYKKVD